MPKRIRRTVIRDGILHTYRKIIKVGESYAITIPPSWIKEHGLQHGDEMVMAANNIITLAKRTQEKKDK